MTNLLWVCLEGTEPGEQGPRFPGVVRRGDQENDRDTLAVFRLEFETETNEHHVGERSDDRRALYRVLEGVER